MDLKDKAQKIIDAKVLVIGDLMLDRFTYGDVIRISPEAPVPVLHVSNEENYLGGAGNVARNISALIGNNNNDNIFMIGVIGKDRSADIIMENINYANISSKGIVIDDTRSTITKTRIVAGTQQIVRIDEEDTSPFSSNIVKNIEKAFMDNVDNYNVVIISDYNKGVITKQLSKKIIDTCNKKNKAVLVDPAIKHFSFYKKATLMTPNLKEAVEGAESKSPFYEFDAKAIKVLGENIIKKLSLSKLMITLGANGMALFDKDIKLKDKNIPYIIPTKAKSVFDVSGAGDTVISVLAMCLSVGLSFKESSEIANAAAGVVVGKRGTSTLSLKELIDVL
ncbi:D-glycero-beta-D-manno-heptose-7-phosphate kinase [Brachyspira hyodysenteriae]|uniref:D-glycero-beta-D-manno-heptose-7-phosphate kinase n=1 Tax=Brachyspira hyodysenteriae TaxID=159 RepID=UPI0022CD2875|nr:D-glycero-beta-D-manno-heptose-7-phosphate kinase [Brachyspira hyodysenteriae]MCZ9871482.1 D-glycero-beta-D-manno-heptose-7-phosphate kinase [Brachyspira hyodysenteriae]MCZ9878015.1 D-glycero-beta-D-manno-heptose-7-phosphate kinase [Brachyspira hyodysenteriae]MCZ9898492.1 D-glycero-beta-D-manno-heptose-7-phosphate kinase [Brachyspira hyodysenteriae]MCZ9952631.1 D-glycero-beta-D-manno-heptose-7-phosphate kinase [Brachyspira hyodysenteriae]MCZ9974037.1 D-glycero-beta-D-manno-heptose-7-phospha